MKKFTFKLNSENSMKENDFSHFFIDSKSGEKKKLITDVVKKANEDQRKVMEEGKLRSAH